MLHDFVFLYLRDLVLKALHRFHWHHMIEPKGVLNEWEFEGGPEHYRKCSWGECTFKVRVDYAGRQIATN